MKRAQAAMEFLMTYGWAILIVIAVISSLAYFGVLNPNQLIEGQCVGGGDFTCRDVGPSILDPFGLGNSPGIIYNLVSSRDLQITNAVFIELSGSQFECVGTLFEGVVRSSELPAAISVNGAPSTPTSVTAGEIFELQVFCQNDPIPASGTEVYGELLLTYNIEDSTSIDKFQVITLRNMKFS